MLENNATILQGHQYRHIGQEVMTTHQYVWLGECGEGGRMRIRLMKETPGVSNVCMVAIATCV